MSAGIESEGGFLPTGTYECVSADTFFLKIDTVPASGLDPAHFQHCCIDTELKNIIPPICDAAQGSLKTRTVGLQLTDSDAQFLLNVEPPTAENLEYAQALHRIIYSSVLIPSLPELGHTQGFKLYLKDYFGDEFQVSSNVTLLGKHFSYCRYSTSQPDQTIYHKTKFLRDRAIIGATQLPSPVSKTIIGSAGEDKKGLNGESQAIASMIQVATKLGLEAVKHKQHFSKALILGYARVVESDLCPYKLIMDFTERDSKILRANTLMDPSKYIASIKFLLNNPENISD